MRYWLLTSTTYGTWLPGDQRGSIASVKERRSGDPLSAERQEHDQPGEAWELEMPGLWNASHTRMKGLPVFLTLAHAQGLLTQLQETATYRNQMLLAVAIMANHFHLVVGVTDNPDPGKILGDFKSYGSRVLNRDFGCPASGTWWTAEGSKRKLPDENALLAATNYVLHKQPNPLLTWAPKG